MTVQGESAPEVDMNRRDFLASTAAIGGAMVLGFYLPTSAQAARIEGQPWYQDPMLPELNAWLTIAPDDTVTIRVAQTEMGTGVFTSCSMMVAEELQCDWSKVRAEYASPRRNAVEKAPEWTLPVPGGGNPTIRDGGGEQQPFPRFRARHLQVIPAFPDRAARIGGHPAIHAGIAAAHGRFTAAGRIERIAAARNPQRPLRSAFGRIAMG